MNLVQKWKNRHRHTWQAVSVSHTTRTRDENPDRLGPWTHVSWRCTGCGKLTTSKQQGDFKLEHFAS